MIKELSGNLLNAEADALINTVNTEGVMGKGIALQFKKAYPSMFQAYRRAAKAGDVQLGRMHVWPTGQMSGPRYIINFPTKGHWKSSSKLKDIESGLTDLVKVIRELAIESVAVPPLGCGNGGLSWSEVAPRIIAALEQIPEVDALLFAPAGAPAASEMVTATPRPVMNPNRAALVEILYRYANQALVAPGQIEAQKLLYFLQFAGQPLSLNFTKHHYGPYADNLRHVLHLVEGHFISGFGDGSSRVADAEPLLVLPAAADEAETTLAGDLEAMTRIDRVLALAEGFESPYGLELLSTVHFTASSAELTDDEAILKAVWAWSPRKARMFTEDHVRTALNALRSQGWLEPALISA